jgi:hypothetical protein
VQAKSCPQNKIKVIVRSWGDEPVALFLHSIDNKRAYVGRAQSKIAIGIPFEQVFLFDEGAFSSLLSAFRSGNHRILASTYAKLAVNSPCNKYQDILELRHDKENISDSRSVAESSER